MRNAIILFTLAALMVIGTQAASAETAPDWSLQSANGQQIRLSEEVSEQTVILFAWATWCPYCKALMPHLQSISYEYGDNIKILAVQIDDKGDAAAFVKNAGYDFTVLPNGARVADLYRIHATPGLMIVDSRQEIRFDLRDVPGLPESDKKTAHASRASKLAPYWAAVLRTSLDKVVAESKQ